MKKSSQQFRKATVDDVEEIVGQIFALDRKVRSGNGIPLDARSTAFIVMKAIKSGACLIGGGAVAGGLTARFPFNQNVIIGIVYFWNFTRPSGIHILRAIAVEFEKLGASHIVCASHAPNHTISRFYQKCGIVPEELQHIGKISSILA